MATLEEAIHAYMERRSYHGIRSCEISRGNVEGLLTGKRPKDKDGKEKPPYSYALMQLDGMGESLRMEVTSTEIVKNLPEAIKESVKGYPNKKPKAVKIYQDFIHFLKIKYEVEIPIDYPYLYANEFDRQMFIVRELHGGDLGMTHLEDRLWTGSKTIKNDLDSLEDGSVHILGQRVTIDGMDRGDGSIRFASTVHPIFLTTNVEQVIAMLEGLRIMSENPIFKGHVMPMVANIWSELSEYGKKRVLDHIDSLFLDREWYEKLSQLESEGLYHTEAQCSSDRGVENAMYLLKNRKPCSLVYLDGRGEKLRLSKTMIVDADKKHVTVLKDGIPLRIKSNRIIRMTAEA